ncbi:MAG TPA: iron dicitrate transport regulator FecR [Prolixibacteraceae bacterium]|nr:iron dicitrate transport regulator FecR [Prolixibacteraceae bacterium]
MKQNDEHIDLSTIDQQSKTFFSGGKFHWEKSEADIWASMEDQIVDQPKGLLMSINFGLAKWVVAASIVILFSIGSFLRFYTTTIENPAGQHLEAMLPDQSKVNLNAQSSISYNPYWWKISRKVTLEGEAFFEVQKGKKFTVVSEKGTTQVMGTSFNIFAREEIYKVTCITGTVKVRSLLGYEAIIKPNSKAEINGQGGIDVLTNIETFPEISWKKNIFLFTASPIYAVFTEIERQYGVKIDTKINDESLYTGNFNKDQNVEDILEYVCPALGLKYVRKSVGEYLIIQKGE